MPRNPTPTPRAILPSDASIILSLKQQFSGNTQTDRQTDRQTDTQAN